MKKSLLFAFWFSSIGIISYAYADSCDPAKVGAINVMGVRVDAKKEEILATIKALSGQNTEVSKQVIASLQQNIDALEKNRTISTEGAGEEAFLQCKEKQQPLQTAIDIGVVYATGGLATLLPPNAWHIDAGDVPKNPLGGKCSFVRNPLQHGCR
ncbi:MAG: hypothetical protein ACXV74_00480 [Methylobacter sp.]